MELVKQKGLPVHQAGLAPIVIIILIAILSVGGYLLYSQQTRPTPPPQNPAVTPPAPQATPAPSPTPDETTNWKTYTSTKYNFSFKYPETWIDVGSGGDPTLETSISNEGKSAPLAGTNKHVFLMIQSNQGTKLAQCFATNLSKTDSKSTSDVIMSGYPAKKYSVDSSPPAGELAYATIYTTLYQNRCYILEFLSLSKEARNSNMSTSDQILSTFKFLP